MGNANYTEDIDNQNDDNYSYDAIGNLISDASEGITNIQWNVYGKIKSINKTNGTTIQYTYDASGNRISKTVIPPSPKGVLRTGARGLTWYVRDASGNVMAVYTVTGNDSLYQSEQHLYGSSRLGIFSRNVNADASLPQGVNADLIGNYVISYFTRGNKNYELGNHLGNVLLTLSDKKIGHSTDGSLIDYFEADVVSANDYYPFGMGMPGRKYSIANTNYRYGFQGQMKSTEIDAAGNHYTAEFWEYDSRTGRRWNLDPKPMVGISQYATFNNNPIYYSDPLGDTTHYYSMKGQFLGGINNDGSLSRVKVNDKMSNKVGGQLSQSMGMV